MFLDLFLREYRDICAGLDDSAAFLAFFCKPFNGYCQLVYALVRVNGVDYAVLDIKYRLSDCGIALAEILKVPLSKFSELHKSSENLGF